MMPHPPVADVSQLFLRKQWQERPATSSLIFLFMAGLYVSAENLDPRRRRRLIELLKTFEHTRLIATHDFELVVEICPRVIVLDHGRVVEQGLTPAILGDEALILRHGLEKPHSLKHRHPY